DCVRRSASMRAMSAGRTARERVRAELIREITGIARRQLATHGAHGLSLRAVAREMGMVSSAIYRYFPSRDDLLTALILDGYNAIGEAVAGADATRPRDDPTGRWLAVWRAAPACALPPPPDAHAGRWLAVCRASRDWALAHPHEYALLYGSPVPGYRAPRDTVGPATRATAVYGRILADAHEAGVLDPPPVGPPPPASFAA